MKFLFNQPMKIYNNLWNADDWATKGIHCGVYSLTLDLTTDYITAHETGSNGSQMVKVPYTLDPKP